jgi:hypothetical protein
VTIHILPCLVNASSPLLRLCLQRRPANTSCRQCHDWNQQVFNRCSPLSGRMDQSQHQNRASPTTDPDLEHLLIGGRGLGAALLFRHLADPATPLATETPLIFRRAADRYPRRPGFATTSPFTPPSRASMGMPTPVAFSARP